MIARIVAFAALVLLAMMCGFGAGSQLLTGSGSGAVFMALLAGVFGWVAYKIAFDRAES